MMSIGKNKEKSHQSKIKVNVMLVMLFAQTVLLKAML